MPNDLTKEQQIINYINNVVQQLNTQYNGIVDNDKLQKAIDMFKDSKESYDVIVNKINLLAKQMVENYLAQKEKRFNPELVKKNHEEIYTKLEILVRKLNDKGIDYQLAGALCAYLKYGIESDRTHDDIDINLNEKDIDKFREVCEEMGLLFQDNRLSTPRVLKNGIPSGEHEVIATLENSNFHIGAFCFERKLDGTIVNKGYYHDENGNVFSRNDTLSPELAKELFGRQQIDFRGQRLVITPPEYIYKLKSYTQSEKDKVDLIFMESRIDRNKLTRINELSNDHQITHEKVSSKGLSQTFSYNNHTYRSGKDEHCNEFDILEYARKFGITALGFCDNIPNPSLILPDEDNRMLLSEVHDYLASINKLKQDNSDMIILTGFEAEYDPMKASFLGEMRDMVDYMVLGQHFVNRGLQMISPKNNPNYPIEYANMVGKAIDSGIFDIVAHPDIFLQYRETIKDEEAKKLFDENSVLASQIICEKARDMGIPIEINFNCNQEKQNISFWKIASEIDGLQVLNGIDAKTPEQINNILNGQNKMSDIIEMMSDKTLPKNYNPIIARQNNRKLQDAYTKTQESALTFETHMSDSLVKEICSSLKDGLNSEEIAIGIGQGLNMSVQECVDNANKKDKSIVDEISTIVDRTDISLSEKKVVAERKKQALDETNQVLNNQQGLIEKTKGNVLTAMNIGCNTKEEYTNMTTQLIEHNSTTKETHKNRIEKQVTSFQQSKGITNTMTNGKNFILTRSQENNKGFVNTLGIVLMVTFIVGFVTGITYMLCKLWIGG